MNIRKLVKSIVPRGLFQKVEPTGHLLEAVLWNVLYGFPGRNLKVIGVTGTNGKTTTSYLIHRMLVEAGYKAGLMTTVAYGIGSDIRPQLQHFTNVPSRELMRRLREMKGQGMDWLVLETTSHALVQHRTWGVPYSVAVMTNVTHEHLDYHKTFENYVAAKKRLFERAEANVKGIQVGIANADDPVGPMYAKVTSNPVLYGIGKGDISAEDVQLSAQGIEYKAVTSDESYHIRSSLAGSFNVYNTLAAVCVGRTLGLSREQIEQGIAALPSVDGRMVTVDEGQPFAVIVDYAHTPDSFEKLLKDLRPMVQGRLIVLFGSAGRRDESKRAVQGRLAGTYADEVVITEEDDRDMDGDDIMRQIAAGAEKAGKKQGKNLFLEHNRTKAIALALSRAIGPNDMVLLLGKGHEKTIERNGPRAAELRHLQQDDTNPYRVKTDPWDEVGTARDALRALASK